MLFDSAFAKPTTFQSLKKKANLAHIRHDYKLAPETDDEEIYALATKEDRIVITEDNDFKGWVKPKGAGVFIMRPYLSNDQMDKLLAKFISGKNPEDYKGRATKI